MDIVEKTPGTSWATKLVHVKYLVVLSARTLTEIEKKCFLLSPVCHIFS